MDVPADWKVLGWLYMALVVMRVVCVHVLFSQSLLDLLSKRQESTNQHCRKAEA